ncbi:MAG: AMP-binding protein, partial [Mycobacteriales bacterium]
RATNATYFNYVGRALAYVLATPPTDQDADNCLRLGFGTEASARDADLFSARFGCHLVDSYGSSEGAVVISRTPGTPRGALGSPPPGMDVAVVDSDGAECRRAVFDDVGLLVNSSEAIGEIVNRSGAAAFEGYYKNADAEAERVSGTWYRSGDLGYRDEAGWFWFAGRSSDWLRVDSENFAAAPVEAVLARYQRAVMVSVYAVPDGRTGDQVMAALELTDGASFDPEHFAAFLQEQADLGTKWAPRFLRLVASMPLTATNKVDKQPLRAQQWSAVPHDVWWRPGRELAYQPLSLTDREALRAEFADNERLGLLAALKT